MYVNAPHLDHNGYLAVPNSIPYTMRGELGEYTSAAEAFNDAHNFSGTFPYAASSTFRRDMQSGRVGPGRFDVTPYGAIYREVRASTPIVLVKKRKGGENYAVETLYPRFFGSGGYNTGIYCHELDIYPGGGHWEALANQAITANLKARCLAEAKNKLSKNQIDIAEALAGLDKTVLMVAERVAQVALAFRQARRGEYQKSAKTLGLDRKNLNFKTPANAWLEFQYGWRPLLTDIYNGMNEANYQLSSTDKHIRALRRLDQSLITRPPDVDYPAGDHFKETEGSTHRGSVSVEVKFVGRVNSPTLAYLASLQALNPAYLAWVSLPFSFVIDWLLPVGDWLSAITAPLGLTFVSGYRTTRISGEWTFVSRSKEIQQPLLWDFVKKHGVASATYRIAHMDREKFYTWPIESFYFRFPFNSSERAANAVALVASTSRFR